MSLHGKVAAFLPRFKMIAYDGKFGKEERGDNPGRVVLLFFPTQYVALFGATAFTWFTEAAITMMPPLPTPPPPPAPIMCWFRK